MNGGEVILIAAIAVIILTAVYALVEWRTEREWGENPPGIGDIFKKDRRW